MDTRFIGIIILAVIVVFVGLLSVSLLDNQDNQTASGAQAGFFYQVRTTMTNWYRALFGLQPLPGSQTNSTCQTLWWFDNTTTICQQKSFCGAYAYQGLRTFKTKEECEAALAGGTLSVKERACISSGGTVTTSTCCKATSDFPNLCAIGACGCSPTNSHQVKTCNCGTGKCFNGKTCATVSSSGRTINQ